MCVCAYVCESGVRSCMRGGDGGGGGDGEIESEREREREGERERERERERKRERERERDGERARRVRDISAWYLIKDSQAYEPTRQNRRAERLKDPEEHAPPPLDAHKSPPEPDEQGRQRAAAVRTMHPPALLARISAFGLVSALALADTSQGLGTVVPRTLSIPGRWAGPLIREIEMK